VTESGRSRKQRLPRRRRGRWSRIADRDQLLKIKNEPDGQITKTCPALNRKIFRFLRRANQFYQLAPSFPGKRGGSRVVTNAGLDAVDAAASARKVFAGQIF
jgi:hypothetical protein